MNTKLKTLLLFVILLLNYKDILAQSKDHLPGELIVQLKSHSDIQQILADFNKTVEKKANIGVKKVLSKTLNIYLLRFDDQLIKDEILLNFMSRRLEVVAAQYNHYTSERSITPNDPSFSNQWSLNNLGGGSNPPDVDIDAPEAWDVTTGGLNALGDTIVVAVIDGGFDLNHADLHFWKNWNEIPGDAIDNDSNGYVDDFDGWNAYSSTGTVTSSNHGTHVSGIVGARGNNSTGVTGVNWNVQIMPVQGSSTTESTVIEAYGYVLEMRKKYNQTNGQEGAYVVSTNSSFGVNNGNPASFPIWCSFYDSLGSYGIISAGATANASFNIDVTGDIPTACPSDFLISVTNTNKQDTLNAGSAYGLTTIDLGAPGTGIYSTYQSGGYGQLTGTSMATPHVAGAIALMYAAATSQLLSQYQQAPDSLALLMKHYLMCGVDTLQQLTGKTVTGGRLNLKNALYNIKYDSCFNYSGIPAVPENLFLSLTNAFPNPASDVVDISYMLPENKSSKIIIDNILGQKVWVEELEPKAGVFQKKLDLSSFNEGMYFIYIVCDGRESNIKKVIVAD